MTIATTQNHVISSDMIVSQKSKSSARKVEGVKRVNGFNIPLASIIEVEGFNARMDSVENDKHIDDMARAFANGSAPEPVSVVAIEDADGNVKFKLFDGHCTTRGIHRSNDIYGNNIEMVEARIFDMDEKAQRLAISNSNRQKKLNMIERGKNYSDLIKLDGMKQTEVAEALNVSQAEVSNCVRAYGMPDSLKKLVAKGIMSDNEAFRTYTAETKKDPSATGFKIAQKIISKSRANVQTGKTRKVRIADLTSNATVQKAPKKVRIGSNERDVLAQAGAVVNTLLTDVEPKDGETVNVKMTKEQVEALKALGLIFA